MSCICFKSSVNAVIPYREESPPLPGQDLGLSDQKKYPMLPRGTSIFGHESWGAVYGNVEERVRVDNKIVEFFSQRSPLNPERTAVQDFKLVFMPEKVDGTFHTIDNFKDRVIKAKRLHPYYDWVSVKTPDISKKIWDNPDDPGKEYNSYRSELFQVKIGDDSLASFRGNSRFEGTYDTVKNKVKHVASKSESKQPYWFACSKKAVVKEPTPSLDHASGLELVTAAYAFCHPDQKYFWGANNEGGTHFARFGDNMLTDIRTGVLDEGKRHLVVRFGEKG